MVNAGWLNPFDIFLQQSLSKLFMNNQINSAKGIGGNMGAGANQFWPRDPAYNGNRAAKITWGSYDSWGGTLRVKPSKSTYAMSGLYMAIPNALGATQSVYTPTQGRPTRRFPRASRENSTLPRWEPLITTMLPPLAVPGGMPSAAACPMETPTRIPTDSSVSPNLAGSQHLARRGWRANMPSA